MVEFENSSSMAVSAEGSVSSSGELPTIPPVTVEKKKRNLPGMPDPDAEVIAMSPKSLLATNRFVCEICNKGFQRDQNLQLHRRGHNLPWKLRQRAGNEVRKRVYVCPELTCVHHDPKRALGDLTGIKKHYCRKHGEKKWKCERCAKKYAVQSDWKAHLKTCGTREYRCDCGTLFSRRDSFITHRAFCDALAQESSRAQTLAVADSEETLTVQTVASSSSSPPQPPPTPSTGVLSPVLSIQSSEVPENLPGQLVHQQPFAASSTTPAATITNGSSSTTGGGNGLNSGSGGVFASIFTSSAPPGFSQPSQSPSSFSDMLCAMAGPDPYSSEPMLLSLSSSSLYLSTNPSLFPNTDQDHHHPCPPQPALSATALLQKAAQMGATGSGSFLRGLGLELSSSSNNLVKSENISIESGLGLGLPTAGPSHLLGPSSLYGAEPTTLDLLGMGMGGGGASTAGFSALLTSIGGGLDVAAATATATAFRVNSNGDSWEGPSERKPSLL